MSGIAQITLDSIRVICINNICNGYEIVNITIGKIYNTDCINTFKTCTEIYITNDIGENVWHDVKYFKRIEDVREDKLNSLGL